MRSLRTHRVICIHDVSTGRGWRPIAHLYVAAKHQEHHTQLSNWICLRIPFWLKAIQLQEFIGSRERENKKVFSVKGRNKINLVKQLLA